MLQWQLIMTSPHYVRNKHAKSVSFTGNFGKPAISSRWGPHPTQYTSDATPQKKDSCS